MSDNPWFHDANIKGWHRRVWNKNFALARKLMDNYTLSETETIPDLKEEIQCICAELLQQEQWQKFADEMMKEILG